jgi:hypothetical protein
MSANILKWFQLNELWMTYQRKKGIEQVWCSPVVLAPWEAGTGGSALAQEFQSSLGITVKPQLQNKSKGCNDLIL